jgi:carbonic anhydrase
VAAEAPKITIARVESAEFENLGSTIETIVNGTTTFNGSDFSLKQLHFHTPSEHRINEEYFPLEMHMVHEAAGTFRYIQKSKAALILNPL